MKLLLVVWHMVVRVPQRPLQPFSLQRSQFFGAGFFDGLDWSFGLDGGHVGL
jgi:hypothetical protein